MDENYNVKYEIKKDWWLIGIIILIWIFTFAIFGRLPAKIPMHWNISGQVDSFGPKHDIFILPSIITIIYFVMLYVPIIDPKRANYGKFAGAYRMIRAVVVIILSAVYFASAYSVLGYRIDVNRMGNLIIPFMLIGFGSVMGKLRHNYFVGIRTPWTLADEEVWNNTHQLAEKLWLIAGIIGLFASFFGGTWVTVFMFVLLITAVIVPIVYSYIIFKNKGK
ncbi:putative integral membrane protein [Thermoanaerobacter thermohydrosulfuricus WC1]|uniref:Putative integral membrane protein n=1 Tax=Thermoanaerobacter thermohydrosulfuricus WC1 TaxID=1198630 RepID=M8CS65_THETY|nr:SdpI family protein [Thermoanaerobacter thermohydrosulfuricus]EMT40040.1 putative integral membrane protein [Thermoanaerobacter thermohydrosulfuricus WC1]